MCPARVADGARGDPVGPQHRHGIARRAEQFAAFGRVFIESRERLPVPPLGDERQPARRGPRLEARKTIVHIGEPVAAFGIFALVHHIDAGHALLGDDGRDRTAQARLARPEPALGLRQAADMGHENPIRGAALHGVLPVAARVARYAWRGKRRSRPSWRYR